MMAPGHFLLNGISVPCVNTNSVVLNAGRRRCVSLGCGDTISVVETLWVEMHEKVS